MTESVSKKLGNVIQIDEEQIQQRLGHLVRGTVEETLNKLLDAEADQLCHTARYERTEVRKDTRSGRYQRKRQAKAGEVTLTCPSCASISLRPPSSSVTSAASHRWKKP